MVWFKFLVVSQPFTPAIVTVMETQPKPLISFLQQDLAIPPHSIPTVLQFCEQTPNRLPVILWQNKLVNLSQLDQIFAWLEQYQGSNTSDLN